MAGQPGAQFDELLHRGSAPKTFGNILPMTPADVAAVRPRQLRSTQHAAVPNGSWTEALFYTFLCVILVCVGLVWFGEATEVGGGCIGVASLYLCASITACRSSGF